MRGEVRSCVNLSYIRKIWWTFAILKIQKALRVARQSIVVWHHSSTHPTIPNSDLIIPLGSSAILSTIQTMTPYKDDKYLLSEAIMFYVSKYESVDWHSIWNIDSPLRSGIRFTIPRFFGEIATVIFKGHVCWHRIRLCVDDNGFEFQLACSRRGDGKNI